MWQLGFAVVFVIVASAICSMGEAALFSIRRAKAKQLADKSKTGKIALHLKENITRPVSTIVIFNNLFNITGTYFIGFLAGQYLPSGWFATLFPYMLTVLVIVFSEIVPKNIGERYPSKILTVLARPIALFTWVLTPIVYLLEKFTSVVIPKPTGVTTTNEDEIKIMARIGTKEGVIEEDEYEMIQRVFRLNDRLARDIMTPRAAMSFVRGDECLEDAKSLIGACEHSRIVVVADTVDKVVGIIRKAKVLEVIVGKYDGSQKIGDLCDESQFVREDAKSDELLQMFQQSKQHIAVVLDEFGGVAGVVTLEDVVEVLTGEIVDETDSHPDLQQEARQNGREKVGVLTGGK